jgi:hypothetical protein
MDTNAKDEFNRMIYDIATDTGSLAERAQNGAKGLTFVEANQVPEQLKGELQSLKDLWAKARSMHLVRTFQLAVKMIGERLLKGWPTSGTLRSTRARSWTGCCASASCIINRWYEIKDVPCARAHITASSTSPAGICGRKMLRGLGRPCGDVHLRQRSEDGRQSRLRAALPSSRPERTSTRIPKKGSY